MDGDEPKDAQEELDEREDEDEDIADPEKLKKKGLHIEGEDEAIDPDLAVADPLVVPDPLREDTDTPMSGEEDEDEVDLVDDAFSDKEDLW